MSGANLPPGCLLDHRVRTEFNDYDLQDQIALQPFRILRCVEKKASGFSDQTSAGEEVERMQIGVHLADAPPGLSCLGLRGGSPFTGVHVVDKNIIVLESTFFDDLSQHVYLLYDAIKGSLHMIPFPQHPSWTYTSLTARVLVVRPRHGGDESVDYALLLAGELDDGGRSRDALLLWRPTSSSSSSSSPPWSEVKASFPDKYRENLYRTDMAFSFDGQAYWADLLRGVAYCCYDALFDHHKDNTVEFGFIPLPVRCSADHRRNRVAQPKAYRTVGVAQDSVRFVSIDGFLEHVNLKDRMVTVWKLQRHNMDWQPEYELRLKTLWKLKGFDKLPKDLTPMYPLLSTVDKNVVYFALGEYREDQRKREFMPLGIHYMLAVNMRDNIVQASYCFGSPAIPELISCDLSQCLSTVSHDLYIMMREMVKQMSLTSLELDPLDYDEAEAKKMIEGPWSWQEAPKEDGPMIKGKCGFPALLPSSYYFSQPY